MAKRELRNDQWNHIKDLLPGKKRDPGRTGRDNRLFVDAVLWIARTGAHWRELPEQFGEWNSVFQRYNRWSKTGVWERMFRKLSGSPDFEYVMIDSPIVRAHQHSAGAKAVIPPRSCANTPRETDFATYAERYRIECFFNKLKHYRAVATRYAKRVRNFASLIYLAASMLWMK